MVEEWKDITGYEGLYQVSNYGRIKTSEKFRQLRNGGSIIYPSKIMKPEIMKLGYLRIMFSKDGIPKKIMIHVLVAEHFLKRKNKSGLKYEVNHIDGNKSNNQVLNLEFITKSENIKHSYRVLGRIPASRK